MYIYGGCEMPELGDQEMSDEDCDLYEEGWEAGYEDFLDGLPLKFQSDDEWVYLVEGEVPAELSGKPMFRPYPVTREDFWFALGCIRGFEQAREDRK